jgi:hypothetical protein
MVIRATSMALAAQEALQNQVILKPTTETITLVDDIIPDDMVSKKHNDLSVLELIVFCRIKIWKHKKEKARSFILN